MTSHEMISNPRGGGVKRLPYKSRTIVNVRKMAAKRAIAKSEAKPEIFVKIARLGKKRKV